MLRDESRFFSNRAISCSSIPGILSLGAATWLEVSQTCSERVNAGQSLPLRLIPTKSSRHFLITVRADKCWHYFYIVGVGKFEGSVIQPFAQYFLGTRGRLVRR
jgi:hypothetical protein